MNKILIVENNLTVLKILHHFFCLEGCDVALASNGLIALNEIEKTTPDIIVTDIVMPKIGGDVSR